MGIKIKNKVSALSFNTYFTANSRLLICLVTNNTEAQHNNFLQQQWTLNYNKKTHTITILIVYIVIYM